MNNKKTGEDDPVMPQESRRNFLKQSTVMAALAFTPPAVLKAAENELDEKAAGFLEKMPLKLEINGVPRQLSVEPRGDTSRPLA